MIGTLAIVLIIDFLMVGLCLLLCDPEIKEMYGNRNADKYWSREIKKYFKDV